MNKFLFLFSIAVFLFLIVPVLIIVYASFSSDMYFLINDSGLSLQWYKEIFYNKKWISSFVNSITIGLYSTLISLIIGIPAALWLMLTNKFYNLIIMLVISPMIIPPLISAVSWFFFFSNIHFYNSFYTLILSHSVIGIPFVVLSVLTSLANFDKKLILAALSCGANWIQIFIKIILPVIIPGIFVGSILSFMSSFDDLIIALFLSDYTTRTIPLEMWSGLRENISPAVLAVTTLLILISFVSMLISYILQKNKYR